MNELKIKSINIVNISILTPYLFVENVESIVIIELCEYLTIISLIQGVWMPTINGTSPMVFGVL